MSMSAKHAGELAETMDRASTRLCKRQADNNLKDPGHDRIRRSMFLFVTMLVIGATVILTGMKKVYLDPINNLLNLM